MPKFNANLHKNGGIFSYCAEFFLNMKAKFQNFCLSLHNNFHYYSNEHNNTWNRIIVR